MSEPYRLLLGREPSASERTIGFHQAPQAMRQAGELVYDSGEGHVAVIAPTGQGKGRNVLIPVLLSNPSPAIVLDVKGELAAITARYRREELGHEVVVLDPWRITGLEAGQFNPLDCLSLDADEISDEAYALSQLLIDQSAPIKEAYWDESASALVSGAMVHLRSLADPKRPATMGEIWKMLTADDVIYNLAVQLDTVKNMHPYARAQFAGLCGLSADVTRSCILSVIQQHVRLYGSGPVQRATERTSFDLNKVRNGDPLTIYIVAPPMKLQSHAPMFRLWLASLLSVICERRSQPKQNTLFLVDEMAQLGRMQQIRQAVTLMRGYGLRCMLFLQSYAQLKQLYPNEHETLFENCGTLMTFGHTAMTMSQQMAQALGDVSPEALNVMARDTLAIRTAEATTRIIERLDYLTDPLFAGRFDPHPMFR
ncbi:MAG: type IV secretory system conjugative DNA transfer family protein [Hyphomonadaceae bacterium]